MTFQISPQDAQFYTDHYRVSRKRQALENRLSVLPGITPSNKLTGIELRLKDVRIKENGTQPFLFFPGNASFYVLTLVLDDLSPEPQGLALKGFKGVGDNTALLVNRTLYYWKQQEASENYPGQVHAMVSIMKSKQGLRNTGKILKTVKDSSEYKGILAKLGSLISSPAAAPFTAFSGIASELAGIVGGALEKVEDRAHYTRFASFTDIAGNFDQLGEHVYPDEYASPNAECNLVLYIRDKEREQKALELLSQKTTDRAPVNLSQIKMNRSTGRKLFV